MENDHLESEAANRLSSDETEACGGVQYVAPAPVIDVLFEQLEYLATHLGKSIDCPSPCPVCARLDLVSRFLLAPFRDPFHRA
jgi:hypothetical protein